MSFLKINNRLAQPKRFGYKPVWYVPKEEEEETHRDRIKFEKGTTFRNRSSRIAGSMKSEPIAYRSRRSFSSRKLRTFFLIAMFTFVVLFYLGELNGWFAAGAIFLLLILFIQRTHRS